MNKLFIYFSLTGNGDLIADILKEKGYEIEKVVEKHKAPKRFFFRVMEGGFRAGMNLKGRLIDYHPEHASDYEEIVIGSPIWNGRFPPAINSVLAETDLSKVKLTFLFYSGSGDIPKVAKKINKEYPNAQIIVLKEPKTHESELEKIKEL